MASVMSLIRKVATSPFSAIKQAIPTSLAGTLSGWGEPPQIGASVSMAGIQGALRTAEYGDTFYLFSLYRDIELNSSHLQCEFGKRAMSVLGQKQTIQPVDKEDEDDVQAQEVIEDMIDHCDNWLDAMLSLFNGHIWPVAISEKIFEPVPASEMHTWRHPVRYRLKQITNVNYALLNYRIAYWGLQGGSGAYPGNGMQLPASAGYFANGSSPGPTYMNGNGDLPESVIWNPNDWEPNIRFWNTLANGQINWSMSDSYKPDPSRHIVHRGNFLSGFRDNFGGAMRGISFWWILSVLGRDWFARFMERYGHPFVVAYINPGQKDLVDLVTKAFNQSTSQGALLIPSQAKIELKETMVSGAADGYEKFLGVCNREISKVVVGQEMSTVATAAGLGSGQADLQGDVRQDIRKHDERKLANTLQKQVFEQFLKINGFRGCVPKTTWGGLSESDMLTYAKTLQTAQQAGLRPIEAALDTVSENLGIKVERIEIESPNEQHKEPVNA